MCSNINREIIIEKFSLFKYLYCIIIRKVLCVQFKCSYWMINWKTQDLVFSRYTFCIMPFLCKSNFFIINISRIFEELKFNVKPAGLRIQLTLECLPTMCVA